MLATVAIELIPWMDESTPDRGVKPAATAAPSSTAASSFDLVQRANAGDQHALDTLCARYLPRLQRWAHGRVPPAARGALQTHDLVQDTLIRVIERLPSFEPRHEGAFQGYVRTALWNRIRDIARQYRRRGQDPLDTEIEGHEHSPLDLAIGEETLESIRGCTRATAAGGKRSDYRAHRNGTAPRRNRGDVRQAERSRGPHGRQSSAGQAGRGDGA